MSLVFFKCKKVKAGTLLIPALFYPFIRKSKCFVSGLFDNQGEFTDFQTKLANAGSIE